MKSQGTRTAPFHPVVTFLFFPILLSCTPDTTVATFIYVPPVTFSGIFFKTVGGDSVYFAGNNAFPNTCRMEGDTVRMYFHSSDFSQVNQIRAGYQLRIDIFPLVRDSTDSGFTEPEYVTLRDVLIRLSEYATPQNTYRVSRPDTMNNAFSVQMRIGALERRRNGRIHLHEIYIGLHKEGFNSLSFEIKRGEISGRIQ
jgi:hypothetical protein